MELLILTAAYLKFRLTGEFLTVMGMNYYTVYENIEVPLLAKGIAKRERKRIIKENMEQVGIADLRKKLPIHISGGQMQRCAIARTERVVRIEDGKII